MEEKTLLKLSILVSLVGVLILYFLSSGIDLKVVSGIQEIKENQEVQIRGKLGKVTQKDTVCFLEIWNEKIIKTPVVLFIDKNITLTPGDYVEITGTIEDYQGKKEVIGNEVVKK